MGEQSFTARKEGFFARARAAGHTLKLGEDGGVDSFVCDEEGHNGPGCTVCGTDWCWHCNPEIEPCDGGVWLAEFNRKRLIEKAAPSLYEASDYVADNTYCGADGEWRFKPGYDPQVVLSALSLARGEGEGQ